MIRTHGKGSLAAIGGMTAMAAVLAGLPAARADELADLRANQQLLQQRIDQLAQAQAQMAPLGAPGTTGGAAYGTHAVPGAALLGGSFPRSFLIPGTDTSIRVGGFASEILDYWFQNGPENGVQTTTVGDNGQVLSQPLNVKGGQRVPGYPTPGNIVPANPAHSRGNGIFSQSPRESRLNVETRTPTAYGEARTFIEFDFAGTNGFSAGGTGQVAVADNLIPRLRYAYGTLGGILAGQANSNFSDPDASPETIDFGGNVGEAGVVRIPQVRYTYAGPYGSAWSASIETPETDVITPAGKTASDASAQVAAPGGGIVFASNGGTGICVANGVTVVNAAGCTLSGDPAVSKAPDITFASYWSQPWGHVDFKLVGRDLTINDGRYVDRSFFGYGGGISGDVKPGWFGWGKDDFTWQFTIGNGLGRYLNEGDDAGLVTNYLVMPTSAAAAALVNVQTVQEFGGDTGYQHWWLNNLRSTASFGYAHQEINSQLIGPVQSTISNKQVMTAHFNLIWSPVAFIDTGVEYMWGQREVVANIRGTEQALIGMFRVKF